MDPTGWFLTSSERDNAATVLDSRHGDGRAWTAGNLVRPLVHGAVYFAELAQRVTAMGPGDRLMFVDWRGDPDERLTPEPGSEVGAVFADAARRGVDVRGLVWRSHWDRLAFSATENRHLGDEINAAGGQVVLDMRVRLGGSHHQKFVVLRHPGASHRDVAYLGGIDLGHSRRDDSTHAGDPQRQAMARVYGPRPPWHDVQVAIQGPAVGDVEAVFRERWQDPAALSRSPFRQLSTRRDHPVTTTPLPTQLPDPPAAGEHPVQVLRTYPQRFGGYPFAPRGERSVARAYMKVLARAEHLVYLEDQYLWSSEVAAVFANALRRQPRLHLIAVLPLHPDQDGRVSMPPNLVSRQRLIDDLNAAGPGRVGIYGIENRLGIPIYVHAKVCIVDDTWASVGSDNFNRRSWTHDSEVSAAVAHPGYARALRDTLVSEHLGTEAKGSLEMDLLPDVFRRTAAELKAWHQNGQRGQRPQGQVRPLPRADLGWRTRWWSVPAYRMVYDPDGRPLNLRLHRTF